LRTIWRGVTGLRFHALLHGADLPSPSHPRRSLGHQHVLSPEERRLDRATPVIRQLLTRAAQRLRDEGFYCQRLLLDIKWVQNLGHYVQERRFRETQDTGFLLKTLLPLWHAAPPLKPLRVGITLADLTPCEKHQPDLFDRQANEAASIAVDKINARCGKGTIAYGANLPYMTSKIAFSRVPAMKEFD
jgi:DNA polymerase-4